MGLGSNKVVLHSLEPIMAEGLRSLSAMNRDNNDKNDGLSLQIRELQEQIREEVLESRMSRQDRDEQADLVARLAAINTKIDSKPVSSIINPLFAHLKISTTTLKVNL